MIALMIYMMIVINKNDSNVNLNHSSDSEGIGEDEQIIRNVISTKGQFSSLLQSRNLSK